MIARLNKAAKLKPVVAGATRRSPIIVPDPPLDLSTAIDSGAIDEKQLIAILTEMCRYLLAAQRKQQPALE